MSRKRHKRPQSSQHTAAQPLAGGTEAVQAAVQLPESQPAQAEPAEQQLVLEEHHKKLYWRAMNDAISGINSRLTELMTDVYFQAIWELKKKDPKAVEKVLLPLVLPSGRRNPAILETKRFLTKCSENTQKRYQELRETNKNSDGMSWFETLMREEFRAADAERIKTYFKGMDLGTCFNIVKRRDTGTYVYDALCGIGLLPQTEYSAWRRVCDDARRVRNNFSGHFDQSAAEQLRTRTDADPEEELKSWYQIAELLHSEKLNREIYDAVQSAREKAREIHKSEAFLFRDLLADIGRSGMDESDLCAAAQSKGIVCDEACVLYCGTREELVNLLEQELDAQREIPLEELRETFGDEIEDLEAYLGSLGIRVRSGMVLSRGKEELLALVDIRLRDLQETRRREWGQSVGLDLEELPKLRALAGYQGGTLSKPQLKELVKTHHIVLDESVLLDERGRKFLLNKLAPLIKDALDDGWEVSKGWPVHLIMDCTTRYHIYQKVEEYKKAEHDCRSISLTEAEQRALSQKLEELKPYETAYIVMKDHLRDEGLLRYIGVARPNSEGREMIRLLLEENRSQRMCVLVCGATPLTKDISREYFPLSAVARIQKALPPAAGNGSVCRIFPQYLPLMDGQAEVDYDLHLRKGLRFPERNHAASAFPDGGAVQVPAASEAAAHPAPQPERTADAGHPPAAKERASRDLPAGTPLWTEEGTEIHIKGYKLLSGGEGTIYQVDQDGMVAKIYHAAFEDGTAAVNREEKLSYMVKHNPRIERLCWPIHLLYAEADRKKFVGYLMLRVPDTAVTFKTSVMQLRKPTVQRETLPGWDREDLVCTARAAADMMRRLHDKNILIGDVNDGNFMVEPGDSSAVYLVDCDSYQIGKYLCPVGSPDYTSPRMSRALERSVDLRYSNTPRVMADDDFSLSVLIFRILTAGLYPFQCDGMTPDQAMREKKYPVESREVERSTWLLRKNMPPDIQEKFVKNFTGEHEVYDNAHSWVASLDGYLAAIENDLSTRELLPHTYFETYNPSTGRFYEEVVCEWCEKKFNMGPNNFSRKVKNQDPLLCPLCEGSLKNPDFSKMTDEYVVCSNCKKQFKANYRQIILTHRLSKSHPVYCPSCEKDEMFLCDVCGHFGTRTIWKLAKERKEKQEKGHPIRCGDCWRKWRKKKKWY